MLILTATNQAIELVTSSAATTYVRAHFSDFVTTPAFTHGRSQVAAIASATTTTIVSAPAASTSRRLKQLSIVNRHASLSQTVTVQVDEAGTNFPILMDITLAPGEGLFYEEGKGWYVLDSSGRLKTRDLVSGGAVAMQQPAIWTNATRSAVRAVTDLNTLWVYMGKAPRAITSSVLMRYRITTAAVTFVWAEAAVATGTPQIGVNPTLSVKGFADVSAVINSLGLKSTTINLSAGQTINEGDDVWLGLGNDVTTPAQVGAGGADDLEMGTSAIGAFRPSLIVGTPTAFTVDTSGAVPLFGVNW